MAQDVAVQTWRPPSILRMDFQPIVDTARGTVVGYESLARFGGPADASPDCWFALAHAAGFGAELEAQVLDRAHRVDLLRDVEDRAIEDQRARLLRQRPHLVRLLERRVRTLQLPGEHEVVRLHVQLLG